MTELNLFKEIHWSLSSLVYSKIRLQGSYLRKIMFYMYSKFCYLFTYLIVHYFLLHSSHQKPSPPWNPHLCIWLLPVHTDPGSLSQGTVHCQLKAISTLHLPFHWIKFCAPDDCNDTAANAGCLQFMNSMNISASIHHFSNVCSVINTKAWKGYLSLHNILKRENSQRINNLVFIYEVIWKAYYNIWNAKHLRASCTKNKTTLMKEHSFLVLE